MPSSSGAPSCSLSRVGNTGQHRSQNPSDEHGTQVISVSSLNKIFAIIISCDDYSLFVFYFFYLRPSPQQGPRSDKSVTCVTQIIWRNVCNFAVLVVLILFATVCLWIRPPRAADTAETESRAVVSRWSVFSVGDGGGRPGPDFTTSLLHGKA